MRHGFGLEYLNTTGVKYEGHWLNDLKNGEGKLTYPDGRIIETQWKLG